MEGPGDEEKGLGNGGDGGPRVSARGHRSPDTERGVGEAERCEFRFYVKPDGKPMLMYVTWSDKNPFEFLTNSEMLIDQWYAAPKF